MFSALNGALGDLAQGLRLAPLWATLGWDQTLARFRRTVLGPFWLSADLLARSFALAVVFGGLLGSNYKATFAQTLTGILCWSLLGGVYTEATSVFVSAASLMTSRRLPLSFHVFLMMFRVLINFAAQLITLWIVLAIMRLGAPPTWQFLVALPIVVCTSFFIALIVAIPATRYRDFGQLVNNLISLLFFLTPVFWLPQQMNRRQQFMVRYNPLAHLIEIVREPLLGRRAASMHWFGSVETCLVSGLIAVLLLALFRKRLIFWL